MHTIVISNVPFIIKGCIIYYWRDPIVGMLLIRLVSCYSLLWLDVNDTLKRFFLLEFCSGKLFFILLSVSYWAEISDRSAITIFVGESSYLSMGVFADNFWGQSILDLVEIRCLAVPVGSFNYLHYFLSELKLMDYDCVLVTGCWKHILWSH